MPEPIINYDAYEIVKKLDSIFFI